MWFRERSLYEEGQYQKAIGALAEGEHLMDREGATWFVSTALGEDKDNVIVRSNGTPTYFASDIAYHYNKFLERDFARVIDIWGADHQGHVSRIKASVGALGIDPQRLTVLISQMVTLKRGDQLLRASKRTGDLITLPELVDEVGPDPCRYFFLARSPESQMEFDLELAKRESAENPVYYIQYAHARISSILKLAEERGIDFTDGDVSLLTHPGEMALVRKLVMLPELVESMARQPGAPPPAALRPGPGRCLPLVLPAVQGGLQRPGGRGADKGQAEAGEGVGGGAGSLPAPHGNGSPGADVDPRLFYGEVSPLPFSVGRVWPPSRLAFVVVALG